MKNIINSTVRMMLLVASSVLLSCNGNGENVQHYTNKVFFSGKTFSRNMRIDREENVSTLTSQVSVGVAKPENKDIDVRLVADAGMLNTYRNAYYDPDAEMLPAEHYDLSTAQLKIKQGDVASEVLTLEFTGLDRLDIDNGHYVLPVSLATSDIETLNGARTLYFVFKKASLVNVAADLNKNLCWPAGGGEVPADRITDDSYKGMHDWNNPEPFKDMETFTIETLLMLGSYKPASIEGSGIQTIVGIEDLFLLRVGDALIPNNQLQVATGQAVEGSVERQNISNSQMKLLLGEWYHIAVTFDRGMTHVYINGREVGSQQFSITSVDFSTARSDENNSQPRCLWVGHSYDIGNRSRYIDGRFAEMRFWNRALSQDEIKAENHFYRVKPDSEGLIGYWKFDDGAGSTAKDYSPYGNDMQFMTPPAWVNVELPAVSNQN